MKANLLKTLLVVSCLSFATVLTSCGDTVEAKPNNINSNIVDFGNNDSDYFRNTIETIYNNLVEGGSTNATVFNELVNNIAKLEVATYADDAKVTELCEEVLLKTAKDGGYSTNNLFDEEKYVKSLKVTNPGMSFVHEGDTSEKFNKNYLIGPEDTFKDVFHANYDEYIEKNVKPEVLKKLLTAKYLSKNSVSSLSRANARDVQYIKLENFASKPGEVNNLINEWLGAYIADPTSSIDLDELQAIYKGVEQDVEGLTGEELARAERINDYISRYYTLADEIDEDLSKIVKTDEDGNFVKENGHYVLLNSDDTDTAIENEYTSSGAYSVEWGEELALRQLQQKDFTGNEIYTKSEGISDLPTDATDRLFSSSIASYIAKSKEGGVSFLTPKTILNGSELSKYYFYDSSSNAYYIIVVNEYYTSSVVNKLIKNNTYAEGNVTYTDSLIDIAFKLADSSTNQRQALVYYLQEYAVGANIHDQAFFDYIEENYSEIIDD